MLRIVSIVLFSLSLISAAHSGGSDKAQAYFISPQDGETLSNPVRIVFGLRGMGVAPAGIQKEGTGHHHLLVNTSLKDMNQPIPSDANHLHFGGGQTETTLELPKGTHTLQMVVGDHTHTPHSSPVTSKVITITVQ